MNKKNAVIAGVAVIAVGLVGVVLLNVKAAGSIVATESESGTKSAQATQLADTSASGGQAVKFTSTNGGACTNDLSCWPNASNTGYQNAPGYPGTHGVADATKLTAASASSSSCPTTFQSNHTYSFCYYTGNNFIGLPNSHISNIHFIGSLFENNDHTTEPGAETMMLYCDSNCTFDYITVKPLGLNAPDLPGHGTSYAKSYGIVLGAGWGAYSTVGHGVSITHSDMWGFGSGIILGANTSATPNLIQDNWLHDQADCPNGCTTHSDGIGMVDTGGSSSYVTINHNNMPFIQGNTNDIAFQQGTYDHLTITNNIFSGDGYTIAIWDTSTNTTFTGNVWTNYAQQYYQVNYGKNFWDTSGSTWKHNKFMWDSNGANPFYELGPGSGNAQPITAADSGKCWVPSGLSTTDYGGGSC